MMKSNNLKIRSQISTSLFLIFSFILGQIFWIFQKNYQIPALGGDSVLYLGPNLEKIYWPYFGYYLFLKVCHILGNQVYFAVIFQSILTLIAAKKLISIGELLLNRRVGLISACIYLLIPELTQWTRYILSESLYFSFTIIVFYYSIRVILLENLKKNLSMFLLSSVITSSLRPNGIIFFVTVLAFLLFIFIKKTMYKLILILVVWFAALFTLGFTSAGSSRTTSRIPKKFFEGQIEYEADFLVQQMPRPLPNVFNFQTMLFYMLEHPLETIKLWAIRLIFEMAQIRPWYSILHNTVTLVTMILFYSFSIVGYIKSRHNKLILFVYFVSTTSALTICLTWAIWEGRFAWWFLVTWIPFVSIGVLTVSNFLSKTLLRRF